MPQRAHHGTENAAFGTLKVLWDGPDLAFDTGMKFRRRPAPRSAKQRRRRRRMHSMMFGATTFFAPHAAKLPPKPWASVPSSAAASVRTASIPIVSVGTEFRLPPEWAYESLIQEAAVQHDLDASLIRAVVAAESAFDANAVSRAGAQGLMQLMPALAEELGVDDAFDPRQNIMAGSRYLRQLLDAHQGDVALALASYNAGPGTVEHYGGIPPYPETQHYVKSITERLARINAVPAPE